MLLNLFILYVFLCHSLANWKFFLATQFPVDSYISQPVCCTQLNAAHTFQYFDFNQYNSRAKKKKKEKNKRKKSVVETNNRCEIHEKRQ